MSILPDEQFLDTDTIEERKKKLDKIHSRVRNWYVKRHSRLLILCFDQFKYFDDLGKRLYFYHQKAITGIVKIVSGKGFVLKVMGKDGRENEVTCLWETKDSLPEPCITSVVDNYFLSKKNEKLVLDYTSSEALDIFKDYNLCFSEGLKYTELVQIV